MKKILILIMPLFLLPLSNVFAETVNTPEPMDYNNGLFDFEENIRSNSFPDEVIDNDRPSFVTINRNVHYVLEFNYLTDIKGMYINTSSNVYMSHIRIFFDNGDVETATPVGSLNGKYHELDYANVRKLELRYFNDTNIRLHEVDFFGSYDKNKPTESVPNPTPEDLKEVENVIVEAEPDRVNLSWELPETEYFEHVKIYRKFLDGNEQEISMFEFLKPMKVHASNDGFKAIFETNGTYFNDLTVEENSKYEYKLTTEYQGLESKGVIVQAETPKSPAPPIEGGGAEKQENGDYLVKWKSPKEGKVKIFIDGQEYVTVDASTGQYLIPANDMKYSPLGTPLIGLQPIGANGQEGTITTPQDLDLSELENPIKVKDVVSSSATLIKIVSSFIVVGLAIMFAPKVIKLIRQTFNSKAEQTSRQPRKQREARISARQERSQRQARISTRQPRLTREARM